MQNILEVENLTKHYREHGFRSNKTLIKAVDHISFALKKGQTLAIVGESGSGKSTLARQLVGIEKPTEGRLIVNGQSIYDLSQKAQKQALLRVRMVFQDPFASLNPRSRIGSILEEPLKINTDLSSTERKQVVAATLQKVGLREDHSRRYAHMFSGGQRQRIAIARALILRPDIIVADEPLSALDVSIQAQTLNLMMELQEELQLSYVFISHDLGVVEHIADKVLVMYQGKLMEYGSVENIFENPIHPYTHTLLASTPSYRKKIASIQGSGLPKSKIKKSQNSCVFASRCPIVQEQCLNLAPKTTLIAERKVSCHFSSDII